MQVGAATSRRRAIVVAVAVVVVAQVGIEEVVEVVEVVAGEATEVVLVAAAEAVIMRTTMCPWSSQWPTPPLFPSEWPLEQWEKRSNFWPTFTGSQQVMLSSSTTTWK